MYYLEYESKGHKDKKLSPKEYLDMIRPYLSDMINDHKTQSEWKIQLTMQINFISSKDSEETRPMHTKSHNIEIMMGNETWNYWKTFWISFTKWSKRLVRLEESMRGREFVFNSIDLLYYHLRKTSLKRGWSYIDSPEWLKNKKATINPKNNENNCFQYTLTVALNYQNIKKTLKEYQKLNILLISVIGKK